MTMNLVGAFKGLSLSSSSSSSFFRGDFGMVTSRNRVSVLFPLESPLSTIESPDKKGVGSTKNVRYSKGKRLGVSIYGDQLAKPGAIISCQHGDEVETLLESMKWDRKGLAVAIAQNVETGAILMQGFSNREALAATISSRKATFYSRSRSSLWTKGETSMNFIDVHDIYLDCDRDSMIYLGKPHGPTCHTGSETCYFSSVYDNLKHHEVETLLDSVKWDDKGLAVAIAQNVDTGAILMQGFANRGALAATISSRKATFYSRSRSSLWTKGETSMNFIDVHHIFLDCDRDSIIYVGKPHGPTCHTGSETCYYSSVNNILKHPEVEENRLLMTTLYSLESTISQRKAEIGATGKPSWTQKLLVKQDLLCSKIREEADELCRTLEENEDKSRTASEMADVLYHTMVLLAVKDVKIEDVLQVLRERFSQSGIEEKKHRKSQDQN